ncbi:structural maintenance of chromosomes protein 2 [Diabrotica virgifera virgifera]|uniref:Structural maintenance of chromosomes protein 2 n=1 Tax=Diabrotica virgifera virgifera TaxID=50390 RepID=A0A6P7FAN7_DIAVI|nr:structural maintenance of chromosomes protein 2 [Diabrotica virgifera virgifera]
MYIKSIVLDGFKSYGQRTEINGFDEQFNAITGLNGSGKSNILDSICFVLGISNLTHVRASSLQDLIFKSGQTGINKATVSITFDNSNEAQCPPGFENYREITITRQIVMGGKNKYMINGTNVPNKKIQDLFCSIQLNVNNPHFLIMQGKITKVLNMKPPEILAMVEEAAGTRMYEVKRQNAQKLIDKKDAKLQELMSIFNEEIGPKLEKLRSEREQFLEYQQVERELEKMNALYMCWQYYQNKHVVQYALKEYEDAQTEIENLQKKIENNIQTAAQIDEEVKTLRARTDTSVKLKEVEAELKEKEKSEAKSNASLKTIKDNINIEQKKLNQLNKNLNDDGKALKIKEQELEKVQSLFETLKKNDEDDNKAFALSQKKFEAVSAGMEVNEAGEAQTLQDQFMQAKEESMRAITESKQASMQLTSCQTQLNQKQKQLGSNSADYERDKAELASKGKEVKALEANISRIDYSENKMSELQKQRQDLTREIRSLREDVERFYSQKPYTKFSYSDPEPNFNKRCVKGVVCQLLKCNDTATCMALETAAGGKLYNVVVDTEATGKKLLKNGRLQRRITFVPLNKIKASKIDNYTIQLAQKLVGAENCKPAMSLIEYDRELQSAMEFVFGNVFICRDLSIAKQISFHDKIRRKCVTLDGDVTDPSGTLSGGAPIKGGSMFLQLWEAQKKEGLLATKERELEKINALIQQLSGQQEKYNSLKHKLDMAQHELNFVQQKLQRTTHHREQEEINNLQVQIETLKEKVKTCKEIETQANKKAKELEAKMKDAKGYREKQLKEAETEMKKMKTKAEKSRNEWKKREQDYETLNLEISELRTGLDTVKDQIEVCKQTIAELQGQYDEMVGGVSELKQAVKALQAEVKQIHAKITENNKDIQKKDKEKEKLLQSNNDIELKIKEWTHELGKLEQNCKIAKEREKEFSKKIDRNNPNLPKAEKMSKKEGHELDSRIKSYDSKKQKLGRVVNTKAQIMFEQEEKQYNELRKREKIVVQDKKKILETIQEMDTQKKNSLKLAYDQVSKDFGSIFSTLLPGANARLVPPPGKTILEGLEVKVSLGGVWKDSLTELSGGQRSLAALSLILAMLLFKPAPLYILDEVDAALDMSHTQNIGNMLKSHFKKSQFIIVSLKDGMFNNANVLFRTKFVNGVSMVSKTVNENR